MDVRVFILMPLLPFPVWILRSCYSATTVSQTVVSVLFCCDVCWCCCVVDEGVYVDTFGDVVRDIRLQWGELPTSVGETLFCLLYQTAVLLTTGLTHAIKHDVYTCLEVFWLTIDGMNFYKFPWGPHQLDLLFHGPDWSRILLLTINYVVQSCDLIN